VVNSLTTRDATAKSPIYGGATISNAMRCSSIGNEAMPPAVLKARRFPATASRA
jgi:hypothetical protein